MIILFIFLFFSLSKIVKKKGQPKYGLLNWRKNLRDRELNSGHLRDRQAYSPLYYREFLSNLFLISIRSNRSAFSKTFRMEVYPIILYY